MAVKASSNNQQSIIVPVKLSCFLVSRDIGVSPSTFLSWNRQEERKQQQHKQNEQQGNNSRRKGINSGHQGASYLST